MLSIIHYFRNVNQNHKEVTSHVGQNGHHQSLQTINAGRVLRKGKPLSLLVGMYIDIVSKEDGVEIP